MGERTSMNTKMSSNPDSVTEINRCRITGSSHLISVLNLGEQYLTGIFPRTPEQVVTKGPLELVWCPDSGAVPAVWLRRGQTHRPRSP